MHFDVSSSKNAVLQILWNYDKQSSSEDFQSCSFTGKERDEETGYGYFGARYMDHELMTMWLSVDPMSYKYPSISPYNYCMWNPVKLIDPDGREIGDYYDKQGNYLGWDGYEDYNVHIVTDRACINRIKNNSVTPLSSVEVALSTNYFVLQRVEDVLDMSIGDNAQHEFCTTMQGTFSADIQSGEYGTAVLPSPPEYGCGATTSIHSHPDADDVYGHWIEYMSAGENKDAQAFQSYDLNIIVGQREHHSEKGAAFYGRQPIGDFSRKEPILTISKTALSKMAHGKMNALLQQYWGIKNEY